MTMPELFADGCHPNDEGYALLAQTVKDTVMAARRNAKPAGQGLPAQICGVPCTDDPDGALQAAVGLSCAAAIAAIPTAACSFDLATWLGDHRPLSDLCPASCGSCTGQPECVAITPRLQQLRPQLGGCYMHQPELRDIVILWRERASEEALAQLVGVDSLLARHLAINIGQMHDMYAVIDTFATRALFEL